MSRLAARLGFVGCILVARPVTGWTRSMVLAAVAAVWWPGAVVGRPGAATRSTYLEPASPG
jgi:hypothetical protein